MRHYLERTKRGLGRTKRPGCRRTFKEAVELDEQLEVWVVALWGLAVAALDVVVVEICGAEFYVLACSLSSFFSLSVLRLGILSSRQLAVLRIHCIALDPFVPIVP